MSGSKNSLSGSGSLMTEASYLKKMEMTCLYENPDQLYDYYRQSLKDIRPDAPLFESDQPRRNNYSTDRLNLRHVGKRVEAMPNLPDGTFLDFDGLQTDVRGSALDPDMKQHRKQQEARGKFIKHGNDEDNSVPSAGWNPVHLVRDMTSQFYPLKNRLKIFDDSMNSMSAGTGINQASRKNTAECMQEADAKSPEMRDEMCYNRANKTVDLSNNTSIGWRRTTDHTFQVAKYGQMRTGNKNSADIIKNKQNSHVAHDIQISYRDQSVSKTLALKMIDLAKKKNNSMNSADVAFDESTINKNRSQKITTDDMAGMQARDTDTSQEAAAHTQLGGEQVQHITGAMAKPRLDSNRMDKVKINTHVVEYMASVNRKMTPREINDLRENILQSVEFSGLMVEQKQKRNKINDKGNELLWSSGANFERGKSMKMANYRKLKPLPVAVDQNQYDFEQYKQIQKTSDQRRGNIQNPEMYNMDVIDYDNDAGIEVVGTKLVGKRGSKYMNPYIDHGDTDKSLMSDITAVC